MISAVSSEHGFKSLLYDSRKYGIYLSIIYLELGIPQEISLVHATIQMFAQNVIQVSFWKKKKKKKKKKEKKKKKKKR